MDKERQIPFSGPMVRAILAGTKTQTRRVVKPQPFGVTLVPSGNHLFDYREDLSDYSRVVDMNKAVTLSPYGQPGDRLWVREAWRACAEADRTTPRDMDPAYRVWYEADAPHQPGFGKYRPPMFMPRWASRITLEITGVRVERLQDISEADAIAEGIETSPSLAFPGRDVFCDYRVPHDPAEWFSNPIDSFRSLWESINGPGSQHANPWVWVVEFKRCT